MKVLFIGGTGLISIACSELAVERGMDLTILNRSISPVHSAPDGSKILIGDVHADLGLLAEKIKGQQFDVVVDWIAYTPDDIERDIKLFSGKTDHFIFISSASAYQKPPVHYVITEETPMENPFWQYSRDKIECERRLIAEYEKKGFPVTIIRPSLTYGLSQIPLIMGSWSNPYTIVDRIKHDRKIIVPGDGTSLWVLTWNGDFARGLLGLFGRKDAIGEAFNITSDEVLTWNQIYEELGRAIGKAPKIVHIPSDLIAAYSPPATGSLIGDKANSAVFDNSKIKKFVPDFQCKVSWAEGVRKSLAWHEEEPARQTLDVESNLLWDKIIDAYEKSFPMI
ncbi:MAG: SDR family oxidoreductase [Chloroflexi bacterium]|nr:SDR family oxidoreductase [Chloroflexota bacterium]